MWWLDILGSQFLIYFDVVSDTTRMGEETRQGRDGTEEAEGEDDPTVCQDFLAVRATTQKQSNGDARIHHEVHLDPASGGGEQQHVAEVPRGPEEDGQEAAAQVNAHWRRETLFATEVLEHHRTLLFVRAVVRSVISFQKLMLDY